MFILYTKERLKNSGWTKFSFSLFFSIPALYTLTEGKNLKRQSEGLGSEEWGRNVAR